MELHDGLGVCDDLSPPKLKMKAQSKLCSVQTNPKPYRNDGEVPSSLVESVSTQELSFSERYPKSTETTRNYTLPLTAKKSLEHPSPGNKSSQKLKKNLSQHPGNGSHGSIHRDPVTYSLINSSSEESVTCSLVNYSLSDEDQPIDEADPCTSKFHLRNHSNLSQTKRRRSQRCHQGFFKSICEEDMADEVESALIKSDENRNCYLMTPHKENNLKQTSAGQQKKATKSRIPAPSSVKKDGFKNAKTKPTFSSKRYKPTSKTRPSMRQVKSALSSNDEDLRSIRIPNVIEDSACSLVSHGKITDRDLPMSSLHTYIPTPRDIGNRGAGPIPLEVWLKSGDYANEVLAGDTTPEQIPKGKSKYLSCGPIHEGSASFRSDRRSVSVNSRGSGYGPLSSTPRGPKVRKIKPIMDNEVSEKGEELMYYPRRNQSTPLHGVNQEDHLSPDLKSNFAIDRQRKLSSTPAIEDSHSNDSPRMKESTSGLSERNDLYALIPIVFPKELRKITQDLASSVDTGANQIFEFFDLDLSLPESGVKYAIQRDSSKLFYLKTEPKPSRDYGEGPSSLVESVSTQELSYSERYPKSTESTRNYALPLTVKKSLEHPLPSNKSSRKRKKNLVQHLRNGSHGSIHHNSVSHSLVNYSMSDEDSTVEDADPCSSKSRLINHSNLSQTKRRRSVRCRQSFFSSMREGDMAAKVKSAFRQSHKKQKVYGVRTSTGRKKKTTRSWIPASSSVTKNGFKNTKFKPAFSSKAIQTDVQINVPPWVIN